MIMNTPAISIINWIIDKIPVGLQPPVSLLVMLHVTTCTLLHEH